MPAIYLESKKNSSILKMLITMFLNENLGHKFSCKVLGINKLFTWLPLSCRMSQKAAHKNLPNRMDGIKELHFFQLSIKSHIT